MSNLLEIDILHSLQTSSGKLPMEVSIALPMSGILALTGPSGAGKTTLLRQIAGLVLPESGRISFSQAQWFDSTQKINVAPQDRNIGFVFQDYALFPHMTVIENLQYALPKGDNPQIITDLLEATDLTQLSKRKPAQLSGGQQQRVALARALVRKPKLLLLDEPFAALDHAMQYQLQDLVLKFHQLYQFSIILVSHDIGEIFRLARQVAVMENGKITAYGNPSEVYLHKKEVSEEFVLHGEVLTVHNSMGKLIVNAIIDNQIREIELPVAMSPQLIPGSSFTVHYSLNNPKITLINPA